MLEFCANWGGGLPELRGDEEGLYGCRKGVPQKRAEKA